MTSQDQSQGGSNQARSAGSDGVSAAAQDLGRLERRTALLISLGCLPLLLAFFWNLCGKPAYRFFPLAILGGIWLMRRSWRTLAADLVPGAGKVVAGLLTLALATLVVSTVQWTPWGGAVGTLLALAGVIWWVGGWLLFRTLFPGFLMFMTVVPLPLGMDAGLLGWLGRKLFRAASRLLYEMSVPHYLSGTTIELPGIRLALTDVGALLNILFSVAVFSLFYMLWRRRSALRICLGVLASVAFTALTVSAAIVVGIRLSLSDRFDVFAGMRGVAMEAGAWVVCAGLVVSFDQVLTFLFTPVFRRRGNADKSVLREVSGPPLFPAVGQSRLALVTGMLFALVGIGQLALGGLFYTHLRELNRPLPARLKSIDNFSMPAQIGTWKRSDVLPLFLPDVPTNGRPIKVWYFETPELAAAVTVDYPERGFPNPAGQYRDAGWTIWRQTPHDLGGPAAVPGVEVEMQRNLMQVGSLWVGALDETGRPLAAPRSSPALFERFKQRVSEPVTAGILVLGCGKEDLSEDDRNKVAGLFQLVGQTISAQIKSQVEAK